jgi:hypothetical protein
MATDCIPQVTFKFYDHLKPVVARFDQAQTSTDGGAVLLKALDDQLQLTDRLAEGLVDRRDPDKIRHPLRDLLHQRIFGLLPVATRMQTTPPAWPTIRGTNWPWDAIR